MIRLLCPENSGHTAPSDNTVPRNSRQQSATSHIRPQAQQEAIHVDDLWMRGDESRLVVHTHRGRIYWTDRNGRPDYATAYDFARWTRNGGRLMARAR
jgi:hypothetical protein